MDSKGQMSADLIFATLLIIIIMGSLVTIIADRMETVETTEELGNARMIAENVAEAVNKVYAGGNGHSVTITLPEDINDKNYSVTVNKDGVFVTIDGMKGKAYSAAKKVSNSFSLSNTNVVMQNNQSYTITNVKDPSTEEYWIVITSA